MTQSYVVFFLIVAALLVLSAMLSSSEAVFVGLDDLRIRTERFSRMRKRLRHLAKRGGAVLIVILLLNNMTNVLISSMLSQKTVVDDPIISSFIIVAIILFFGEMLPKTFSLFKTDMMIVLNHVWFYPLFRFFEPVAQILYRGVERLIRVLRRVHASPPDNETKVEVLLSIVSRENLFSDEEKDMLASVLNFAKREVWNIMTPRIKMESVSVDTLILDILKVCEKSHFSKIPVYEETEDNLVGVVYIQDLLEYVHRQKKNVRTARDMMRPLYYVPETKKLSEMLEDFKQKRLRIAAVVDEYGIAVGIVTIADVLGDIAGEVMDETFGLQKKIAKLTPSRFQVSGDVSLMDFNTFFNTHLQSETYETLAGYLIEKHGDIPEKGVVISADNFVFTVGKSSDKQIEAVIVEVKKRKRG